MRTYKNITFSNDQQTIKALQALSKPGISVDEYRGAFHQIGMALGTLLNSKVGNSYGNTMLACASEDADWLAKGVIDSISQKNISLAVFWNGRITLNEETKLEYSPIIKSFLLSNGSTFARECSSMLRINLYLFSTSVSLKTLINFSGE